MSDASPHIEWYLARDGDQYGPLSDSEMRKFVELGHLRPTDLVWCHGFAEWRPAAGVFPSPAPAAASRPASQPSAQPRQQPNPQGGRSESTREREQQRRAEPSSERSRSSRTGGPDPGARRTERTGRPQKALTPEQTQFDADLGGHDDGLGGPSRSRRLGRVLAILAVVVLLAAGAGWLVRSGGAKIPDLSGLQGLVSRVLPAAAEPDRPGPPIETLRVTPFKGLGDTPEATDQAFQQAALWRVIKQGFPEWYDEHIKEAVRIKTNRRDDAAVAKYLAESVVALRRSNADQALAASPGALRAVASTFLDNLKQLTDYSVDACYAFISQGELSPQVIDLMSSADHVQHLQRQMTAVFEAVAEGRQSPQTHTPPRKADYDALTQALTRRGWSDSDLQLFSDSRALARAKPDVVCKMVQDWFAAQLSIADRDIQLRLLVESLRPVVAG